MAEGPSSGNLVCWQHPLRSTRILMSPETIKTVSAEALRWLLAEPSSEIGGILWGSFESSAEGDVVRISEAEFVFSEDAHFNQTPADAARLAENVHREKAGLLPVGYFRSHIRGGLSLSTQDRQFIEAHLRDPRSAFLIVQPFAMGICMAAFFFWENGQLEGETSELEVPFVALDQRAEKLPETEQPAPVAELAIDAPAAAPSPEKTNRLAARRAIPAIAAAALLGIGTAWLAYFALQAWHTPPIASTGLQVTRLPDGQLDLSWNPRSADAAKARSATLSIRDGSVRREIKLDEAQLQSGRLAYFPVSNDVQFRLELQAADRRAIGESLHVLLPSPPANAPASDAPARYRPPRPLHPVMPDTGILPPAHFARGTQIRVQVDVDKRGRVTAAELLPASANAPAEVREAALTAARRWTFAPATLAGTPVAAQHTIVFEFDGSAR